MITKEQADTIASSILEQERNARMQQKLPKRYTNRRFLYRFKELKQFEAWERPLILLEAEQSAKKEKIFILFVVVNVILAFVGYWYILTSHLHPSISIAIASNGFIFMVVGGSPTFFFKRYLMKKYIHREVKLRKELGYGANSEVNQFVEWNAAQS